MTKKSSSLIIGISVVLIVISILFYSYFLGQFLWGIIAAGMIILIAGILLFLPLITDPLNLSGRGNENSESFGVESICLDDSRVYERPFFFIGVPFIIIAFGGIFSKYESIFSIVHESGTTLVLYHGICLVSKDDKLSIMGKWYRGKKLGIQGNIVVAERVENLSSGIVFEKA